MFAAQWQLTHSVLALCFQASALPRRWRWTTTASTACRSACEPTLVNVRTTAQPAHIPPVREAAARNSNLCGEQMLNKFTAAPRQHALRRQTFDGVSCTTRQSSRASCYPMPMAAGSPARPGHRQLARRRQATHSPAGLVTTRSARTRPTTGPSHTGLQILTCLCAWLCRRSASCASSTRTAPAWRWMTGAWCPTSSARQVCPPGPCAATRSTTPASLLAALITCPHRQVQ
jgi:hypothetical protein